MGTDQATEPTSQQPSPALSLCMIVKNEEAALPRCLRSVRDQVDEIVIVDTGSSDKTVEIAESFGAKVYHHPWENDFSKHRNQSLSYARGDWIFILDADEEVESSEAPKLREIIRDSDACSFFLPVVLVNSSGEGHVQHNWIRLFRNHLGNHYRGIVHNMLVHKGPSRFAPIRVYHYGNSLSPEKMHEKFLRTSTLLKRQLAEDPENFLAHHYLGVAYLGQEDCPRAYEEAKTSLTLARQQGAVSEHVAEIYYVLVSSVFRLGRLGEAEFYALEAVRFHPLHVDSYCLLCSIYWTQNRLQEFLTISDRYLEILQLLETDPGRFGTVGIFTERVLWKVHLFRGLALSHLGRSAEREAEFQEALKTAGPNAECHRILGAFFAEAGESARAWDHFQRALRLDPADAASRKALRRLELREAAPT